MIRRRMIMSSDGDNIMKPIRYNRNVLPYRRPFGGWNFFEGDEVLISADSHKELVSKLIEYRVKNDIKIGNPNYEVEQYICKKNLHLCELGESEYIGKDEKVDPFFEYLKERKVGKGKRLLQHMIHERKIACIACPHNKHIKKKQSYEKEALLIAGELKRDKLYQCSKHIWDNMIAVNYDDHGCEHWSD
jgi:hypothetical protein